MTSLADICNRSLQAIGTRTTVTQAELDAQSSNEAIQFNLIYANIRDDLLRMAPWSCGLNFANLTMITAAPGTPENTTAGTTLWQKGQPPPPYVYEYQYLVDCLKACWIVPQFQTGFAGGIPITTAVTGGAASFWQGPPVKYKVGIDQFYGVTAAVPVAAGLGYTVGDLITLPIGPVTSAPIGAPAVLRVTGVGAGGAITFVSVVNQIAGEASPIGGSYFAIQANPIAQGSTTGAGSGATFTLTQNTTTGDQRVILTNQEFALLAYIKQVTDYNVFDTQFQTALYNAIGAALCLTLNGDKELAKLAVARVNEKITEARKNDGNEGLTVNDVTPDWIRNRGYYPNTNWEFSPNDFDWGPMWPSFG